jgi:hypothetical protein
MLSRSTAISSRHLSVANSVIGDMKLLPALLTTALARPHRPFTKSRSLPTSASFETSAANASALPPPF